MVAVGGKGKSGDSTPGTRHHHGCSDPRGNGRGASSRNEIHYGRSNACQAVHPSAYLWRGGLTHEGRLSVFLGVRCSTAMVDLCSVGKSHCSLLATCHFLPTQRDLCNQDLNRESEWITIATGAWQPGLDWWSLIYGLQILPRDIMHCKGHPNSWNSLRQRGKHSVLILFCLTGLCLPRASGQLTNPTPE